MASLATYYGFNNQDYELSALQEEYQKDLVILAFPCDQFGRVSLYLISFQHFLI